MIALGACAFVAFGCEALAGFGGTVLALALGAHARPLGELLAIFIPANLILSGAIALKHARVVEWRLLLRKIAPAMAAGLPLGLLLNRVAGLALFGAVVIGLGLLEIIRIVARATTTPVRGGTLLLWLAGVVHGAWGSGGPLVVFVTGRSIENTNARRATLAVLWLALNAVLLASLILDGRVDARTLMQTLALLPIVAAALLLGEWLAARLSDRPFRAFGAALLGAAGVLLILRGA